MTDTTQLEQRIRDRAAAVAYRVQMRRDHPSYGYTKAYIRTEFTRLEGLMEAWALATGTYEWADTFGAVQAADEHLKLDINNLRIAVQNC